MADEGPLKNPRLRVIEETLNTGDLEGAQRLLADLGEGSELGVATSYFATRLLFLRGRLDVSELAERMRELVQTTPDFPEATRILEQAEAGTLGKETPESKAEPTARSVSSERPETKGEEAIAQPIQPVAGPPPEDAAQKPSDQAAQWPPVPQMPSDAAPKPPGVSSTGEDELPVPEVPAKPPSKPPGTKSWPPMPRVPDDSAARPATKSSPPQPESEADSAGEPAKSERLPSVKPVARMETPAQDFSALPSTGPPSKPEPSSQRAQTTPPPIPPAPAVPHISTPPDSKPSYVPEPPRPPSDEPQPPSDPEAAQSAAHPTPRPEPGRGLVSDAPPAGQALNDRPLDGHLGRADSNGVGGRYSGSRTKPDEVYSEARRAASGDAGARHTRPYAGAPSQPPSGRIRSGVPAPPSETTTVPTVAELAKLLDTGKFAAALEAMGPDRDNLGPDYVLMRARAHAGLGRREEALLNLLRFCAAPLLDPDLRAGGAQLLIELGDYETAFQQTSRAFAEAPDAPMVRLVHAWAALRLARRRDTSALAHTAETALAGQKSRAGTYPAILLALRACVQAHVADAERAISIAQRALGLDPHSADAQVAVTLASARLKREHDARQAWLRLREVAPEEADAITEQLKEHGVELLPATPSGRPEAERKVLGSVWVPLEVTVLDGKTQEAIGAFEQMCRQRLSDLAEHGADQGFSAIAEFAAKWLTVAPVWMNFAPYDLSLWSIPRVEAALGVLYGAEGSQREDADEFPMLVLVGSYLGEVLCKCHNARWEGSVMDAENVRVVSWEARWTPFQLLSDHLRRKTPLEFELPGESRPAHPGSDPWSQTVPNPAVPPCPWEPETWPQVGSLTHLGRALSYSIISRYCEQRAGSPLDGSFVSLGALDNYLSLIAPSTLRCSPTEPWIPRVAVLAGAYVGEIVRQARGGQWVIPRRAGSLHPESYRLRLGNNQVITPVEQLIKRLTRESTTTLRNYAEQLIG